MLSLIKLKKDDFKYLIYQLIVASSSIILGKLIAVYFEKETFGQYAIIASIFSFFISVFSSPIIQSFRFAYTQLSLISLFSFYRSVYLYLSLLFFIGWAFCSICNSTLFSYEYLFIGIYIYSQINFETNMAFENLIGQNKKLSIFQISSSLISILIILVSIFILKTNSFSVLYIILILPVFVLMLISFHTNKLFLKFNVLSLNNLYHHHWKNNFIKFLAPLFLLPLLSWILNSSDKFIIRYYYGDSELALYAAAYSIGSKLFLILSGPIIIYLNHSTYQIASDKKLHRHLWSILKKRLVLYFIVGIVLVILTLFFYDTIGNLLLSVKYRNSFILIPFLAFANLILTSFAFLEQVVYASGQTKIIIKHYFLGAILNIILNLLLIPHYEFVGAIFIFIFSLIVQFSYLFLMVRNYLLSSLNHES